MPARTTFSAIVCRSASDAIRLALALGSNWTGAGPKPDLIEANGAEVDLTWFTASIGVGVVTAAVNSLSQPSITVSQFRHTDGRTVTTQNN